MEAAWRDRLARDARRLRRRCQKADDLRLSSLVVPVLVDSGFRRGSDIFKALALGATSVGVGRPDIWGLAAFGQPEVEQVLRILRKELLIAMRQAARAPWPR
ncbi:MAG: alpha-hydroxy-acid oxidizing protein [Rhodanobacteraceae bacterium]|nr:alpha-hydroxy-acid oxidizing protein [Rhodanobacteraceae bacterium]